MSIERHAELEAEQRRFIADVNLDAEPDQVEARFQREVLRRARSLESRMRGLFAEVLIAESLPGCELGPHAMSRWDIRWNGIEIGVRTTGTFNSYSLEERTANGWTFRSQFSYDDETGSLTKFKRRAWTDVVVLAHHRGILLREGWTFHVLAAAELLLLPIRITHSRAQKAAPGVSEDELAAAVAAAGHRQAEAARTPVRS